MTMTMTKNKIQNRSLRTERNSIMKKNIFRYVISNFRDVGIPETPKNGPRPLWAAPQMKVMAILNRLNSAHT